jgi:hypothetical protein
MIDIRTAKGLSVGKQFSNVPESTFSVAAEVFLDEWVRFVLAVLDALVAFQPDLVNEESFKEYQDRLLTLRAYQ